MFRDALNGPNLGALMLVGTDKAGELIAHLARMNAADKASAIDALNMQLAVRANANARSFKSVRAAWPPAFHNLDALASRDEIQRATAAAWAWARKKKTPAEFSDAKSRLDDALKCFATVRGMRYEFYESLHGEHKNSCSKYTSKLLASAVENGGITLEESVLFAERAATVDTPLKRIEWQQTCLLAVSATRGAVVMTNTEDWLRAYNANAKINAANNNVRKAIAYSIKHGFGMSLSGTEGRKIANLLTRFKLDDLSQQWDNYGGRTGVESRLETLRAYAQRTQNMSDFNSAAAHFIATYVAENDDRRRKAAPSPATSAERDAHADAMLSEARRAATRTRATTIAAALEGDAYAKARMSRDLGIVEAEARERIIHATRLVERKPATEACDREKPRRPVTSVYNVKIDDVHKITVAAHGRRWLAAEAYNADGALELLKELWRRLPTRITRAQPFGPKSEERTRSYLNSLAPKDTQLGSSHGERTESDDVNWQQVRERLDQSANACHREAVRASRAFVTGMNGVDVSATVPSITHALLGCARVMAAATARVADTADVVERWGTAPRNTQLGSTHGEATESDDLPRGDVDRFAEEWVAAYAEDFPDEETYARRLWSEVNRVERQIRAFGASSRHELFCRLSVELQRQFDRDERFADLILCGGECNACAMGVRQNACLHEELRTTRVAAHVMKDDGTFSGEPVEVLAGGTTYTFCGPGLLTVVDIPQMMRIHDCRELYYEAEMHAAATQSLFTLDGSKPTLFNRLARLVGAVVCNVEGIADFDYGVAKRTSKRGTVFLVTTGHVSVVFRTVCGKPVHADTGDHNLKVSCEGEPVERVQVRCSLPDTCAIVAFFLGMTRPSRKALEENVGDKAVEWIAKYKPSFAFLASLTRRPPTDQPTAPPMAPAGGDESTGNKVQDAEKPEQPVNDGRQTEPRPKSPLLPLYAHLLRDGLHRHACLQRLQDEGYFDPHRPDHAEVLHAIEVMQTNAADPYTTEEYDAFFLELSETHGLSRPRWGLSSSDRDMREEYAMHYLPRRETAHRAELLSALSELAVERVVAVWTERPVSFDDARTDCPALSYEPWLLPDWWGEHTRCFGHASDVRSRQVRADAMDALIAAWISDPATFHLINVSTDGPRRISTTVQRASREDEEPSEVLDASITDLAGRFEPAVDPVAYAANILFAAVSATIEAVKPPRCEGAPGGGLRWTSGTSSASTPAMPAERAPHQPQEHARKVFLRIQLPAAATASALFTGIVSFGLRVSKKTAAMLFVAGTCALALRLSDAQTWHHAVAIEAHEDKEYAPNAPSQHGMPDLLPSRTAMVTHRAWRTGAFSLLPPMQARFQSQEVRPALNANLGACPNDEVFAQRLRARVDEAARSQRTLTDALTPEGRLAYSLVTAAVLQAQYHFTATRQVFQRPRHLSGYLHGVFDLKKTKLPDPSFQCRITAPVKGGPTIEATTTEFGLFDSQGARRLPGYRNAAYGHEQKIVAAAMRVGQIMPPIGSSFVAECREFARQYNATIAPLHPDHVKNHDEWMTRYSTARARQLYDSASSMKLKQLTRCKSFIKRETQPKPSIPRAINAYSDHSKIYLGFIVSSIEKALFAGDNFVKGRPVRELGSRLISKFAGKKVITTDYTAFECHHREEYSEIFLDFVFHMLQGIDDGKRKEVIARMVRGTNVIDFGDVSCTVERRLMSGALWTSLQNTYMNLVFSGTLTRIALREQGKNLDASEVLALVPMLFEGDDGIMEDIGQNLELSAAGGLLLKSERHENVTDAGFCCQYVISADASVVCDPNKVLRKLYLIEGRYAEASWKTKYAVLRAKALSYAYLYPNAPVVTAACRHILRLTPSRMPLHVWRENMPYQMHYGRPCTAEMLLKMAEEAEAVAHADLPITDDARNAVNRLFGVNPDVQVEMEATFYRSGPNVRWDFDVWHEPDDDFAAEYLYSSGVVDTAALADFPNFAKCAARDQPFASKVSAECDTILEGNGWTHAGLFRSTIQDASQRAPDDFDHECCGARTGTLPRPQKAHQHYNVQTRDTEKPTPRRGRRTLPSGCVRRSCPSSLTGKVAKALNVSPKSIKVNNPRPAKRPAPLPTSNTGTRKKFQAPRSVRAALKSRRLERTIPRPAAQKTETTQSRGSFPPELHKVVDAHHGRITDPDGVALVDERKFRAVAARIPFKREVTLNAGEKLLICPNPHSAGMFDTVKFDASVWDTSQPDFTKVGGENIALINNPFYYGLGIQKDLVIDVFGANKATYLPVEFPKGDLRLAVGSSGGTSNVYAYQVVGGEYVAEVATNTNGSAVVHRLSASDVPSKGVHSTRDLAAMDMQTMFNNGGVSAVLQENTAWLPRGGLPMYNQLQTIDVPGTHWSTYTTTGGGDLNGNSVMPITAPKFYPPLFNFQSANSPWQFASETQMLRSEEDKRFGARVQVDRAPGAIAWSNFNTAEYVNLSPVGLTWATNTWAAHYNSNVNAWVTSGPNGRRGAPPVTSPPIAADGFVPNYNPFAGMSLGQDAFMIRDTSAVSGIVVNSTRVLVTGYVKLVLLVPSESAFGAVDLDRFEAHVPWLPSTLQSVDVANFQYTSDDPARPDVGVYQPSRPVEIATRTRTLGDRLKGVFKTVRAAASDTWHDVKGMVIEPTVREAARLIREKGIPLLLDAGTKLATGALMAL